MIARLKKINEVLPEMIAGILFWGMLCQITGVWFVSDKAGCSAGLWIGILAAAAMSIHMAWTLDRAMELGEKDAAAVMTRQYMLRYGTVLVIEGVIIATGIANPLTAFLGIMGLKVAAYLQPVTHKLFRR